MPKQNLQVLHSNFIKAARLVMLENNIDAESVFATEWLGVSKQTFYGIKEGRMPTLEQTMVLCQKGGFNANWLLFDQGEQRLNKQNSIDAIFEEIEALKKHIIQAQS